MAKADTATSYEELEDDEGFETLSAKAAIGFMKKLQGEFLRQIEVLEE